MFFRFLCLAAAWVLVCFSLPVTGYADSGNGIVAKVGSVEITTYEVGREMRRILPFNSTFHGGLAPEKVDKVRQDALENLIERGYKIQYGLLNEISLPKGAVEEKMKQVKEKFSSEKELEKALKGESLSAFRSAVHRLLLAKQVEEEVVDKKARATDEELRRYYEEKKGMFYRPTRYKASHILIKVDPALPEAERVKLLVKAEDLTERALAGEDFYNLAYYNSDEDSKFVGGDIGYFHSGQVVKEFENAVKDLKPGDIVGPVETLSGFHVIKLTDVEPPRQMTFEETEPKIRKILEEKRREALYREWMDELKKQYKVEVYVK